jgi:hypothetical protein
MPLSIPYTSCFAPLHEQQQHPPQPPQPIARAIFAAGKESGLV